MVNNFNVWTKKEKQLLIILPCWDDCDIVTSAVLKACIGTEVNGVSGWMCQYLGHKDEGCMEIMKKRSNSIVCRGLSAFQSAFPTSSHSKGIPPPPCPLTGFPGPAPVVFPLIFLFVLMKVWSWTLKLIGKTWRWLEICGDHLSNDFRDNSGGKRMKINIFISKWRTYYFSLQICTFIAVSFSFRYAYSGIIHTFSQRMQVMMSAPRCAKEAGGCVISFDLYFVVSEIWNIQQIASEEITVHMYSTKMVMFKIMSSVYFRVSWFRRINYKRRRWCLV